jgi:hypothetical protein
MSLCMRWLYVVILSGLHVTTWWLEPRDCHLNVNIVEIGYRWWWQDIHEGPRRGEGVPGAGRGAIISCHGGFFDFVATTTFSEMVATTTFSEIAVMASFLKRFPRQWNIGRHVASTRYWRISWRILDAQSYTISFYYELLEMFIPLLFAPFDCWLLVSALVFPRRGEDDAAQQR